MRPLIKLSPSKLETWRKYMDEEYNGFITKEKVIASIKGEVEWIPEAIFGSAFHLVMQFGAEPYFNPDTGRYHIQDNEMPHEVVLTYKEIYLADEFHKKHPHGVWESRATHFMDVDNTRVMLNMRLDMMEGLIIHENKTYTRDMSVDFFEDSFQWRIYLLTTKAAEVRYNVFSYDEPNTKRKEYEVYYDHMSLFPYPDIENEVRQGIRGLMEFCRIYELNDWLFVKPKIKTLA